MARRRIPCLVAVGAAVSLLWAGTALGAEVHGKVTDQLGEPIVGITVCAHGQLPLMGGDCDWQTDLEGNYSIAGLAEGQFAVDAHVEGAPTLNYVPQWYSGKAHPDEADPVNLAKEESREIDFQMHPGGEVHGTVADSGTDLPIEQVDVCAEHPSVSQSGDFTYCSRSNADGEFTIRNLATGDYRLSFRTEGEVNYVDEQLPEAPATIHLNAGGGIEVEAHLVRGVQIEGTVTDAGTGEPVVSLPPPHGGSAVCALDSATEARIKCALVGSDGHYVIGGLPAGTYVVSFSLDWVEEEMDLHPDGYVRRYWQEVPSFGEATLVGGSAGAVIGEIDAALTEGEEVFPYCEVVGSCPPPPPSGETETHPVDEGTAPPPVLFKPPPVTRPRSKPRCKTGFHRVKRKGKKRCVKVKRSHPAPRASLTTKR